MQLYIPISLQLFPICRTTNHNIFLKGNLSFSIINLRTTEAVKALDILLRRGTAYLGYQAEVNLISLSKRAILFHMLSVANASHPNKTVQ